ncbi:septum site-determining protein MinC, partial [Clostridioides difficile]|uniref:septum site-determining protein MinC n=1 Tax=Clostridioides difficile TaxID=1496 RepID=UPI003F8D3EFA
VMGDINAGAKVVAGGNVFVMGKIEGFVHAGAEGNEFAYVVAGFKFNSLNLSINKIITVITCIDMNFSITFICKYFITNSI